MIQRTNNSTDCGMASFHRVATDYEPEQYTFTFNNGSKWSIGLLRIANADPAQPIDAFDAAIGSSGNAVAPSINTTGEDRLILALYTNKKAATWSTPTGTTLAFNAPNTAQGQPSNMVSYYHQPPMGGTGTRSSTPTETERWAAQQIAIRPADLLPVEFTGFQAHAVEGPAVRLTWSTASEKGNGYFAVQRSRDAIHLEQVVLLSGQGDSHIVTEYHAKDSAPLPGTSYYRTTRIPLDGKAATIGPVVAVKVGPVNARPVAYPNPTTGPLTIEHCSQAGLVVRDGTGRSIPFRLLDAYPGTEQLTLDLSPLPSGTYLLEGCGTTIQVVRSW